MARETQRGGELGGQVKGLLNQHVTISEALQCEA